MTKCFCDKKKSCKDYPEPGIATALIFPPKDTQQEPSPKLNYIENDKNKLIFKEYVYLFF